MANSGAPAHRSLSEVHGSVLVPTGGNPFRRLLAIAGPAYLVSVGYMDPGNWATDLAAGSGFSYTLLWVLLVSNLMAVLLQSLSARLGIARGLDLAQACRTEYGKGVTFALYLLCEVAITACDLAEVLGSAIALQLLCGLPLLWGVLLTAADTFALLFLSQFGIRKLELFVLSLVTLVASAFFLEVFLAKPDWGGVASGFVPSMPGPAALFVAIGMLGATVMPHNLYLHSALVQTRRLAGGAAAKRQAIRLNTVDSAVALNMAFFVNAAILVMAAAVFYRSGHTEVAEIQDAHALLAPLLGSTFAPLAFAVALLAAGQSSTITGTLAGQIVMEGFLNVRIPPWVRRLITRLLAIVPAVVVILVAGEKSTGGLLVLSQVVLSLQLPFAIVPLVHFVSDRRAMGEFAIGPLLRTLAWVVAALVVFLNGWLVWDVASGWIAAAGAAAPLVGAAVAVPALGLLGLLGYLTAKPWLPAMGAAAPTVGVHEPPQALDLEVELKGAFAVEPYKKVAIALDFSGRDPEVIRETLRLLGGQRPSLCLMHVVESAAARFLGADSADAETQQDTARLERYADELRTLGFEAETRIGVGKPVSELARLVGEFAPEVVVVGAHGHGFLKDLLFGTTADALRHRIGASVFVVGKGRQVASVRSKE